MKHTLIAFVLLFSQVALAEVKPFNAAEFASKLAAGGSVVVAAHATWCSTCRAQKPLLKSLSEQAPYQSLTIYEVDFDKQKPALNQLNITRQSTLVAFKAGKESKRSIGATDTASIETILKATE